MIRVNNLYDSKGKILLSLILFKKPDFWKAFEHKNFYGIFLFNEADGVILEPHQSVDLLPGAAYFYYPYQKFTFSDVSHVKGTALLIHPDFFCIDVQAKDYGCQGVLFNNFFAGSLEVFPDALFEEILNLFQKIDTELRRKDLIYQEMITNLIKNILITSLRFRMEKKKESHTQDPLNLRLHQLESLLNAHYTEEHQIYFYADKLSVSASTLNRICKQGFNKTLVTLIQEKQIAKAKSLFFLTKLSIKQVALELGFQDPLYFSRVFKKKTGVYPTIFREKLLSEGLTNLSI